MSLPLGNRKHLRVPLSSWFLYEDEGFVYKSRLVNISEGGILIESLPHVPSHSPVAVMVDIPKLPLLEGLSLSELMELRPYSFEHDLLRAQIETLRRSEMTTPVDQVFARHIAGKWFHPSSQLNQSIRAYVNSFCTNLAALWGYYLKTNGDPDRIKKVRLWANLLGYEGEAKLSFLHQQLQKDYGEIQKNL